jgi:hypothetical protein
VQRRQFGQAGDVRAVGQARDADHFRAQRSEGAEHQEPGRIVDEDGVAGAGEFARHQVQRLRHAGRGDDLFRRGGDFQFRQFVLQLLAQRQEALRHAVAEQQVGILAADGAQRVGDGRAVQPFGRQHAGAGHLLVRHLAEHIPHQPDHVDRFGVEAGVRGALRCCAAPLSAALSAIAGRSRTKKPAPRRDSR